MSSSPRAAFVTIGQTPRADLIPEMRAWIGPQLEVVEFGALDGLEDGDIAAMAPRPEDQRLVTRLADGRQAIVRKDLIHRRLQELFDAIAGDRFFCTVLLCTGRFPSFQVGGLFLDAQSLVDHGATALAEHAGTIGLMLPLAEQIAGFHFVPRPDQSLTSAAASPYANGNLDEAARALAGANLIVMHCMGYSNEMRQRVATVTGRPVLLARRLVAAAVAQLL